MLMANDTNPTIESTDTLQLTQSTSPPQAETTNLNKSSVNNKTINKTASYPTLDSSSNRPSSFSQIENSSAHHSSIHHSSIEFGSPSIVSLSENQTIESVHNSSDHSCSPANGFRSHSDNSLQFSILKQTHPIGDHPTGDHPTGDHSHINNSTNKFDRYCDCKHSLIGGDHNLLNHQCNNNLCNHTTYESDRCAHNSIDLVNRIDLFSSLNDDLYDRNLNAYLYGGTEHGPCDYDRINGSSFEKNANLNCKDCLFKSENCLCTNLVTKQPSRSANSQIGNPLSNSNPPVNSTLITSSSLVNRTSKVNPRLPRYFEPLFEQPDLKKKNLHYSATNQNSQSSPSLSTHHSSFNSSNSSDHCACFDCFDLFANRTTKLTGSLSDSLFNNLKHNLTSSLLSSSSSLNSTHKSSSSKYLSTTSCLPSKLNLIIRLVRKLYFYICFLVGLLLRLVPLRNTTKDDQHKLCEHRSKIMRLKERVVILMIIVCCVLCTFFVLQLKISEDMDSSTKFR